jgi:hypothetical protein
VLRKLADRIDRGFNIEVRIEPLPAPAEESDAKTKAERQQYEQHRQIIESAAKQLEFLRIEGQPILHLENPPDSPKDKK